MPDKGVLGIDRGKVEIIARGVVIGQQALIAKGRVDIKRPGLERLHQVMPRVVGIAFENQPAVQTETRNDTVGRLGAAWQGRIKLITTGMQLHFRREEPGRPQPGPTDLQNPQGALRIGLQGAQSVRFKLCQIPVE